MEIIIRQPEKKEAKRTADLLLLAWPTENFIDETVGMTYEKLRDTIASTIEEENTLYSYTNTVVAELIDKEKGIESELIGALNGYDGDDYEKLKKPVLKALNLSEDSPFGKLKETEGNEYYLDSIGVDAAYRGHGVARKLFAAKFEIAKRLGYTKAGLIVDVDKKSAESLYSFIGFKFENYMDYMGQPHKHMTINL